MNILKGKYRKSIPLASVRTDICVGRVKQLTDEHVRELEGLLVDGIEYDRRPLVTEDGVLIYGHHRTEAKRAFFLARNVPEAEQMLDADVLPISWDKASDAEKEQLENVAYKENAEHKKTKASTFADLRFHVGRMLDRGRTPKEIIAALSPEVTATQTRRALAEHQKITTQASVKFAQTLVAQGTSKRKALSSAGLPTDYDLPEKGSRQRQSPTHRFRETAKRMSDAWSRIANQKIENYRLTGIGQPQLVEMATNITASAAILHRKAESVQTQVNSAIQERAKRERR